MTERQLCGIRAIFEHMKDILRFISTSPGNRCRTSLRACLIAFLISTLALIPAFADTPGAAIQPGSDTDGVIISWTDELMEGIPAFIDVTVLNDNYLVNFHKAGVQRTLKAIRIVVRFDEDPSRDVFEGAIQTRRWETDEGHFAEAWYEAEEMNGEWHVSVRLSPTLSITHLAVCKRGYWKDQAIVMMAVRNVNGYDASAIPEVPARIIPCTTPLQVDNKNPCNELDASSIYLAENRIGSQSFALRNPTYFDPEVFPGGRLDTTHVLDLGLKSFRLSLNNLDSEKIDWAVSDAAITPEQDRFIRNLAAEGVSVIYNLSFWDKEYAGSESALSIPRFKSEEEIERYLSFVQLISSRFKGVVQAYEIWNEPSSAGFIAWIEVEDYVSVAKRAIEVIRREDPHAEVYVGGTHNLCDPWSEKYLREVIESGIMPQVDGLTWHGMYGISPVCTGGSAYYYNYPDLVRQLKNLAERHGFRGAYMSDELNWQTPDVPMSSDPCTNSYSEVVSAKYYARGIVTNLGLDVAASVILLPGKPEWDAVIRNLCNTLAGHESVVMPLTIVTEADLVVHCTFRFPNGDRMLAIWDDGVARDFSPGKKTTVRIAGLEVGGAVAIDILDGIEQPLDFTSGPNGTIVRDLLLRDYPLLIRLSNVNAYAGFFETPGDSLVRTATD